MTEKQEARATDAKRTLVHYFRLALEKNGVPLNYDSVIEIKGIVDDIIEACTEQK